jgi:hypothetical protein
MITENAKKIKNRLTELLNNAETIKTKDALEELIVLELMTIQIDKIYKELPSAFAEAMEHYYRIPEWIEKWAFNSSLTEVSLKNSIGNKKEFEIKPVNSNERKFTIVTY